MRNYHIIKNLAQRGHEVTFLYLQGSGATDMAGLATLRTTSVSPVRHGLVRKIWSVIGKRTLPALDEYRNSGLREAFIELVNEQEFDTVQLEQFHAYYALKDALPEARKRDCRIILDAHNVEHIALKGILPFMPVWKRLAAGYVLGEIKKSETEAFRSVDHIFACSEEDMARITKYVSASKVSLLPNGVDTQEITPAKGPVCGNKVLFIGELQHPPNQEAARLLVDEIFPRVLESVPSAELVIVGTEPPRWLLAKSGDKVRVTGFVDDIKPILGEATVCVCPLPVGSGTRLKILTYMAAGKPVVSTTVGAEGLHFERNEEIIIADEQQQFAREIVGLMQDSEKATRIGMNARKKVVRTYDWADIIRSAEFHLKNA